MANLAIAPTCKQPPSPLGLAIHNLLGIWQEKRCGGRVGGHETPPRALTHAYRATATCFILPRVIARRASNIIHSSAFIIEGER